MKRTVVYRPEVEHDVREAFVWYESQRPGLGWELALCIEEAIERIRDNPDLFPVAHSRVRRAPVRRFPYGVFFVPTSNVVMVLAVLHSGRDPHLWKSRRLKGL